MVNRMIKEVFKRNRERLMEKVNDNSIVILFAGNAPIETFTILEELMKRSIF